MSSADPILDYPVATLQLTYANRIHSRMSVPKQTFVIGESLPVSLELMDGITRVKNLRTRVTMTKLEDPVVQPTFVLFHDDGLNGDLQTTSSTRHQLRPGIAFYDKRYGGRKLELWTAIQCHEFFTVQNESDGHDRSCQSMHSFQVVSHGDNF